MRCPVCVQYVCTCAPGDWHREVSRSFEAFARHSSEATEKPRRVQLSRAKGWKMPPNTVKVDRSTRWGNPYVAVLAGAINPHWYVEGPGIGTHPAAGICGNQEGATLKAVALFRQRVAPTLDLSPLQGKNLACWCKPGAPCHADVLLELANAPADVGSEQLSRDA